MRSIVARAASLCCAGCVVCLFFFFQAEDGIRDVAVTGVQTCALPIFGGGRPLGHDGQKGRFVAVPGGRAADKDVVAGLADERSEERRVGKECRSRWSPYQ